MKSSIFLLHIKVTSVSAFNFCLMLWHSHQSLTLKHWCFNDRFWSFWWCTLKLSALPLSKDVSSTVFSHLTLRKKFLFLKSLINSWCFRKSPSGCLKQNYEQFLNSVIFASIRSQGLSSDLPLAYFPPIGVKYRVSTLPALCSNAMVLLESDGDVNAHTSSFLITYKSAIS